MPGRLIGFFVAQTFIVAATLLPESWFADGLRYLAFTYIAVDLILRARAGYRRRRPYWTTDSWRRFWAVCAVPVVALLVMVAMMFALEMRLPIVGEARSTIRGIWAGGTLAFMLVGVIGLVSAIEWLHRGEPSDQFALPAWLSRQQGL